MRLIANVLEYGLFFGGLFCFVTANWAYHERKDRLGNREWPLVIVWAGWGVACWAIVASLWQIGWRLS